MNDKRRLMELMLNKKRQPDNRVAKAVIQKRDRDMPAELSFAQQRLWFLDELTPGNAAYAFCNIVRFDGKIDVSCLQKSFNEIINRHENLRTLFKVERGVAAQEILDTIELPFPIVDLLNVAESEKENKLTEAGVS